MIAIAAFVFLQLGDWYGAIAFAVGLVAIMEHKLVLFTGQTGKLFNKPKDERKNFIVFLLCVWLGNFIGAFGVGQLLSLLPANAEIVIKATAITGGLAAQGFFSLFVMSIFVGFWFIQLPLAATGYSRYCAWWHLLRGSFHIVSRQCVIQV